MKIVKSFNILFISIILFCAVAMSCSEDNEPDVSNEHEEVFDFAWIDQNSIWTTYPDSTMLVLNIDSNLQVFTKDPYLNFLGEDNNAELTLLMLNSKVDFWLGCTFNTMVTDTFKIWHITYKNHESNIEFLNHPKWTASWKTKKFQIIKTGNRDDSLSVEAAFHIKTKSTDTNIKDIKGAFRYNGKKANRLVSSL